MRRAIVTRPRAQAQEWLRRLAEHGRSACSLPLLDIAPPDDPAPVRAAWASLAARDLVVFVSPSAVEQFFAQAPDGSGWPAGLAAAAPGPGTLAVAGAHGVAEHDRIGPPAGSAQFDGEALWDVLCARDWSGRSVLLVRGADDEAGEGGPGSDEPWPGQGRPWLARQLQAAGARVDAVVAYVRAAPIWSKAEQDDLAAALARPQAHAWLLTSSQGIQQLLGRLGGGLPPGAHAAVATHARIAASAREAGFTQVLESRPALQDVLGALAQLDAAPGAQATLS